MNYQYNGEILKRDFTASGTKIEGPWENDRNRCSKTLITDMIKEAFGVDQVFVGHHILYELPDDHQGAVPEELPSFDTMMFDHDIMERLFGDKYLEVIVYLAKEPVETRDQLLGQFYYNR